VPIEKIQDLLEEAGLPKTANSSFMMAAQAKLFLSAQLLALCTSLS
jgi:hypothetical protein